MDWTQIIIALIGAACGGGLTTLLFLPQARRAKELENENKAIDQWKELYERLEQDSISKSNLIDRVFSDLRKSQERAITLSSDNARLEILKCECVNCPTRKPPIGYRARVLKKKTEKNETTE